MYSRIYLLGFWHLNLRREGSMIRYRTQLATASVPLGQGTLPISSPENRPVFARIGLLPPSRSSLHAFCIRTIDLASVSTVVRSFSNNVRRRHPIVSANLVGNRT